MQNRRIFLRVLEPVHLIYFLPHQNVIGLHIMCITFINILTIVVSAIDPKLLIKMLHVTFTGGPVEREKQQNNNNK